LPYFIGEGEENTQGEESRSEISHAVREKEEERKHKGGNSDNAQQHGYKSCCKTADGEVEGPDKDKKNNSSDRTESEHKTAPFERL